MSIEIRCLPPLQPRRGGMFIFKSFCLQIGETVHHAFFDRNFKGISLGIVVMTDNPNVILIYGDDLGRGMLSCYGQQHFETPNIDRLANYDVMPTLADLIGMELPQAKDGVSFLPTLLEQPDVQQHREWVVYASRLGPALITTDGWKLRYINSTDSFQLYHLPHDYREENDVSSDHPDLVAQLSGWMLNACDGNYQNGTPQAHFAAYPDSN